MRHDSLDGYLAGNFADADLAGLSDEQAAVEGLNAETAEWHRAVLKEGRDALAAPDLDWRRLADYANRNFQSEQEARQWLARMLDVLKRALGKLS